MGCQLLEVGSHDKMSYLRVGNGLDRIETALYNELDVACGQAIDTLLLLVPSHHSSDRIARTSSADTGVGAPGALIVLSSYCSSSLLILTPVCGKIW